MFARFPFALNRFLKRRLTLPEAGRIVRQRMERRQEQFLAIVQRSIYGHPQSPYLALLQMAGCEFGDLCGLVKQKGIEGALRDLRQADVYVTYEEFKGRKPIQRGRKTISVTARDFDNPFARRDWTMQTSGSTGLATLVNQDLDNIAEISPQLMLAYEAYGMLGAPMVIWGQFLPGPALRTVFQAAVMGQSIQRWFAPNGWRDSKYWLKYSTATVYMLAWTRALGYPAPFPEIRRYEQAETVARYISGLLKQHGRVLASGGVSRAMRTSLAAAELGIDLSGVVFRMGGEPLTAAKAAVIERVGARAFPGYVSTETGSIALGCANPSEPGDFHLLRDSFALITHPHLVPALGDTVPAFNVTALLDTAPKILFNAQLDDYGIVEERECGCGLEACGYTTHLRAIRSYSKLVGEGVTLIGNELLNVLESVLPARFGGTAFDYQFQEREDAQGFTRLYLAIHPRVNLSDEQAVIQVVLDALKNSSPMADAARVVWQQAQTIQIKRSAPVLTENGKFIPLYTQRAQPTL